jgi:hypothetical protein
MDNVDILLIESVNLFIIIHNDVHFNTEQCSVHFNTK